jgi:hypothetical protein
VAAVAQLRRAARSSRQTVAVLAREVLDGRADVALDLR